METWEYLIGIGLFLLGGGFFGKLIPLLIERKDKSKAQTKEMIGQIVSRINSLNLALTSLLERVIESFSESIEQQEKARKALNSHYEHWEEYMALFKSCKKEEEVDCSRCKELQEVISSYKEIKYDNDLFFKDVSSGIKKDLKVHKFSLEGAEDVYIKTLNSKVRNKIIKLIGDYEILLARTSLSVETDETMKALSDNILLLRTKLMQIKELILEK